MRGGAANGGAGGNALQVEGSVTVTLVNNGTIKSGGGGGGNGGAGGAGSLSEAAGSFSRERPRPTSLHSHSSGSVVSEVRALGRLCLLVSCRALGETFQDKKKYARGGTQSERE